MAGELPVRSLSLRNAPVVAALRANGVVDGLSEAKSLQAAFGLGRDSERELLDALAADGMRESPALAASERLPEPWLEASCERLLQRSDVEHAARFLLARPERERAGAVGRGEAALTSARRRGTYSRGALGMGSPGRRAVRIRTRLFSSQGAPWMPTQEVGVIRARPLIAPSMLPAR